MAPKEESGPQSTRSSGTTREITRLADNVDMWAKAVQKREVADARREGQREVREVQRAADFKAEIVALETRFDSRMAHVERSLDDVVKDVNEACAVPVPISQVPTAPIHIPHPTGPNAELANDEQRARIKLWKGLTLAIAGISTLVGAAGAWLWKAVYGP